MLAHVETFIVIQTVSPAIGSAFNHLKVKNYFVFTIYSAQSAAKSFHLQRRVTKLVD